MKCTCILHSTTSPGESCGGYFQDDGVSSQLTGAVRSPCAWSQSLVRITRSKQSWFPTEGWTPPGQPCVTDSVQQGSEKTFFYSSFAESQIVVLYQASVTCRCAARGTHLVWPAASRCCAKRVHLEANQPRHDCVELGGYSTTGGEANKYTV